jgi:hypothetical protein
MTTETNDNLCVKCRFRFRRLLIPAPEDYEAGYESDNEENNEEFDPDNDNIMIINTCLITGMDITREITIDCSHFSKIEEVSKINKVPFFKHM